MPVSRQEASEALEDFKREYTGLSQVKYVLLENKKDFHDHYGPNAERAVQAWAGKLGAYSRSTRTIALALAATMTNRKLRPPSPTKELDIPASILSQVQKNEG